MKIRHYLAASAASMLIPAFASAGVIIDSIRVELVASGYDARRFEGSSEEAFAAAQGAFERAETVCSESLRAFTDVSYRGICGGGSGRNFGSRYTITGSVMGLAAFEFGLDWGRGGFIAGAGSAGAPLVYLDEDIWWNRNWKHEDVMGRGSEAAASIVIPTTDSFTLTLLGFEDCCDGINSGRYRSLAHEEEIFDSAGPLPVPTDGDWTELAVSAVPAPATLPLFGLGAAYLLLRRRRPA